MEHGGNLRGISHHDARYWMFYFTVLTLYLAFCFVNHCVRPTNTRAYINVPFLTEDRRTHLTMCLCLSTQYLMALLTSISCFFVNPFGPTPPLNVIPAVGRKVAVKSCRLLYMLRRSRSNMLSLWGSAGGGGAFSVSRRWSALPACAEK